MRYTTLTIFLATVLACIGHSSISAKFKGESISVLDYSSLHQVPMHTADADPLADVAEAVRMRIDPTKSPQWDQNGYTEDFKKTITETYASYNEFWKRIPLSSRRLIDFDHDGHMEYFVTSRGMKKTAWGFSEFFAVLKKDPYKEAAPWKLAFLYVLDNERWPDDEFQLVVTDLDRDGRPDVLLQTHTVGGSHGSWYLHVVSLPASMAYSHHILHSSYHVSVLYPDQLRPIFDQWSYDDWRDDDCGASVSVRGCRQTFYHWTCNKGFVEM